MNAFTSSPFAGNPASVCLLEDAAVPDALLKGVAAQMNHSETAFVTRVAEEDEFGTADTFRIRWFTPTTEVKLCGHATLAAAAVLFKVSCIRTAPGSGWIVGRSSERRAVKGPAPAVLRQSEGIWIAGGAPRSLPEKHKI